MLVLGVVYVLYNLEPHIAMGYTINAAGTRMMGVCVCPWDPSDERAAWRVVSPASSMRSASGRGHNNIMYYNIVEYTITYTNQHTM